MNVETEQKVWHHKCVDCGEPAGVWWEQFPAPCEEARCTKCQRDLVDGSLWRVRRSKWD